MCQWGPFPELYIFFHCKMVLPTLIKGEKSKGWGVHSSGGYR